ncbi:hydroxypyruvate isomerase family protein [Ammoniphilus sp. YIM 78166]|uniref:hydroxypyruvate isomerase family protein n=1 Tax=Ammoniphilus sp. YIM 78166 TaxID=1644106 RepID=UPI00106FE99A|nr:hydroxypyruvate isomerase family protein [Ammoniphilus sp. YIM 78166]
MLKFAANLSTLFTEVEFMKRFSEAQKAGFRYIEFQFPYAYPFESIKREMEMREQELILFNLPPGNWEKGERGISIIPDRRQEFREGVEEGIRYAEVLGCSKLHCMAGILPHDLDFRDAGKVYEENIRFAADRLREYEITLMIEPINRLDMPGYFLHRLDQAVGWIQEWKLPNVKLQFDFYHVQRMQGELLSSFAQCQEYIGHVQIADNPGRHQPGTGEIHYPNVFRFLQERGYTGFIGLEYFSLGNTAQSLDWLQAMDREV